MNEKLNNGLDWSGPVLDISDLWLRSSAGKDLVKGVSLSIEPGEIHGLVGESGSGKTLTGYACLGMLPAGVEHAAGSVHVDGRSVLDLDAQSLRAMRGPTVAMIAQDPLSGFHPMYKVGKQILDALSDHGVSADVAKRRVIEVLTQARLNDPEKVAEKFPHELSGGMRQRAMIALALAHSPKLLLADEPTTALDPTVQIGILSLLRSLRDDGLAVLFVTHNLGVVSGLTDTVSVMNQGRIVESGGVGQVLLEPQDPYTTKLLEASPRLSSEPQFHENLRPGSQPTQIIELKNLVKRYPLPAKGVFGRREHVEATSDVSLSLDAGQTVALVGESGSGKSTLARLILGLEQPSAGEIKVCGLDLSKGLGRAQEREFRDQVQMVFQDASRSLDPRFTIHGLLHEALRLTNAAVEEKDVAELCDLVHLPRAVLQQYPGELSGGLKQRVSIARAVARDPKLLVADEPVSALDVTNQQRIVELFRDLAYEKHLTLVIVAHDLALVRDMSDVVVTMRQGKVVETSSARDFYTSPRHPYSQALLEAMPDSTRIGYIPNIDHLLSRM